MDGPVLNRVVLGSAFLSGRAPSLFAPEVGRGSFAADPVCRNELFDVVGDEPYCAPNSYVG